MTVDACGSCLAPLETHPWLLTYEEVIKKGRGQCMPKTLRFVSTQRICTMAWQACPCRAGANSYKRVHQLYAAHNLCTESVKTQSLKDGSALQHWQKQVER